MTTQTTSMYEARITFESRPDDAGDHYQVEGVFSFLGENGDTLDRPMVATAKPGERIVVQPYPAEWGGNAKGDRGDAANLAAFDVAEAILTGALRDRIEQMMER